MLAARGRDLDLVFVSWLGALIKRAVCCICCAAGASDNRLPARTKLQKRTNAAGGKGGGGVAAAGAKGAKKQAGAQAAGRVLPEAGKRQQRSGRAGAGADSSAEGPSAPFETLGGGSQTEGLTATDVVVQFPLGTDWTSADTVAAQHTTGPSLPRRSDEGRSENGREKEPQPEEVESAPVGRRSLMRGLSKRIDRAASALGTRVATAVLGPAPTDALLLLSEEDGGGAGVAPAAAAEEIVGDAEAASRTGGEGSAAGKRPSLAAVGEAGSGERPAEGAGTGAKLKRTVKVVRVVKKRRAGQGGELAAGSADEGPRTVEGKVQTGAPSAAAAPDARARQADTLAGETALVLPPKTPKRPRPKGESTPAKYSLPAIPMGATSMAAERPVGGAAVAAPATLQKAAAGPPPASSSGKGVLRSAPLPASGASELALRLAAAAEPPAGGAKASPARPAPPKRGVGSAAPAPRARINAAGAAAEAEPQGSPELLELRRMRLREARRHRADGAFALLMVFIAWVILTWFILAYGEHHLRSTLH